MIDHTGLGVRDMEKSSRFYDAVLGALGMRRVAQFPDGSGADAVGYGFEFPIFWIDHFHPHGAGRHTSFSASSRKRVDAFFTEALKFGGTDNGAPELRNPAGGYPPGYYSAFVLDPDGNNMEAVCRKR